MAVALYFVGYHSLTSTLYFSVGLCLKAESVFPPRPPLCLAASAALSPDGGMILEMFPK